jgi:hypothetical protein
MPSALSAITDFAALVFGSEYPAFASRRRIWSARRARAVSSQHLVVGQCAKVAGAARVHEHVLTTPFTKRPALACRARMFEKATEQDPRGDEVEVWKPAVDGVLSVPFVIEDGEGSVRIDANAAILVTTEDFVNEHPHVNDENPELRAFLRRHGVLTTLYMGIAGDHRFLEAVLSPGEPVEAWGRVSETASVATAGYRDAAGRTKTITGTPDDPCVLLVARG